jgi:glycolate oxidase
VPPVADIPPVEPAAARRACADLRAQLPAGRVLDDRDVVAAYRSDQAALVTGGVPCAVVRPASTDEVATALAVADAHRVPVVTRGAGSGLSGGAAAIEGGIVALPVSVGRAGSDARRWGSLCGPVDASRVEQDP